MSYHRLREGDEGPRVLDPLRRRRARHRLAGARGSPATRSSPGGRWARATRCAAAGQNLLLVGGGIGIAPLLWLADEAVAKGRSVVLIDGARDARGVFPAELVPREVEVVVTTQDGSVGRQGLVTDVFLDYYDWADQVFVCGPNPMFAALADLLRSHEGSQRARAPQAGAGAAGVADGLRHRHLLRLRGLRPSWRAPPRLQRRPPLRAAGDLVTRFDTAG